MVGFEWGGWMDWKSFGLMVIGVSGAGAALLHFAGKWLEVRDARWKVRALAAEKSKADLEDAIRGLETDNAALQKQIDDFKARPSAETIIPPDLPARMRPHHWMVME
jgi:hypothetical protein